MKVSRFNFFINSDKGEKIAFNALTGALAMMNDESFNEYLIIEKGLPDPSQTISEKRKEIQENLLRGGFIFYEDAVDEMELIEFSFQKAKYDDRILNLTIAPTLKCNFNCFYCYQKKSEYEKNTMNQETIDQIIRYVDHYLRHKLRFTVTWYGGEPLLAFEVIKQLSKKFVELSKKHKCEYISKIITNGYFLDKNVVDELVKYNLKSAQITIDGIKNIHDSRRYDINTRVSFDRIIENIKYAKEFMGINIRLNLDKENIDYVDSFFSFLIDNELVDKNISVSLGPVVNCNQDLNAAQLNQIYNTRDFYKKEKEIISRAVNQNNISWVGRYPSPIALPCGAINISTFAIDPDGFVYKCWEILGDRNEAIYHISNPLISKNEIKWIKWNPQLDEDCKTCKSLTLCNGGCVLHAMNGKKTCTYWKDNLNDMLSILAYKYKFLSKNGQSGVSNA